MGGGNVALPTFLLPSRGIKNNHSHLPYPLFHAHKKKQKQKHVLKPQTQANHNLSVEDSPFN